MHQEFGVLVVALDGIVVKLQSFVHFSQSMEAAAKTIWYTGIFLVIF